jgi:3-methylcrotonyl-CoA carboxylase alpha subunit
MHASVLIANRGEIAIRIARTARRLGMRIIAIASEAERDAPHVRIADAVHILPGADPRSSYLNIAAIIEAAAQAGAEAIHPGYGFLSENPQFAEACAAADIDFVGPPAAAIRAMGHKDTAKRLMARAGVPLAPGYHGETQTTAFLADRAAEIGFPVMLKAVAGGGGKGMRRVMAPEDFPAALEACRREARASFGDDRMLIEKFVPDARHIEFQILADAHGNCIHLLERECSLQRRHQKVIEEAPAPGMTMALRKTIGEAAVEGAKTAGYRGAGTVEFIASKDLSSFYFMEMNTRLQVEHPVTEMITGFDLVEMQFRIAAGERLPDKQADIHPRGHAAEARLYAEDPAHDFLPQTGKLYRLKWPEQTSDLRIDTGVEQGGEITPYFDPMIAKLIAHGRTRTEALHRLAAALSGTTIVGVKTNQRFLINLISDRQMMAGGVTTGFIGANLDKLSGRKLRPDAKAEAAAAWMLAHARPAAGPWDHGGWSLAGTPRHDIVALRINGEEDLYTIAAAGDGLLRISADDREHEVAPPESWHLDSNGRLHLASGGTQMDVAAVDQLARAAAGHDGAAQATAPMTGKVIKVHAREGQPVKRGDPLVVIEAMKMEHIVRAGIDGTVSAMLAAEGTTVPEGASLCTLEPLTP